MIFPAGGKDHAGVFGVGLAHEDGDLEWLRGGLGGGAGADDAVDLPDEVAFAGFRDGVLLCDGRACEHERKVEGLRGPAEEGGGEREDEEESGNRGEGGEEVLMGLEAEEGDEGGAEDDGQNAPGDAGVDGVGEEEVESEPEGEGEKEGDCDAEEAFEGGQGGIE